MDFAQTAGGDLATLNGDLFVIESDQQHVADIIIAAPGWWKEYPQLGVGLFTYFGTDGLVQQLTTSISLQLASDGYQSSPQAQYQIGNGQYLVYPNASINQS